MSFTLPLRGRAVFPAILIGQVVSLFGSNLTAFVLGVWVFKQTGSVTDFALIAFFSMLPKMVLSPIAGSLVDRWDRRWALILSDVGAGLCTGTIALLLWADRLEIWHIYAAVLVSGIFETFQAPAFNASLPLLVPKAHLVRANGLVELAIGGAAMVGPLAAGALLDMIELWGVILIDLGSFAFAVSVMLLVRIPRPEGQSQRQVGRSLMAEFWDGWAFVRQYRGLVLLLVTFAAFNFVSGIVEVLFVPLVLGFASSTVLGTVMAIGAGGFFAGGAFISALGWKRRKVPTILVVLMVQGSILLLGGLKPSVPLVACAIFAYSACSPILLACAQSLWQVKVPAGLQGRVFAFRRVIASSMMPVGYLLAGPLADKIFEPMLAPGGLLAGSVGQVIGVGPGRGVGLLLMVLGVTVISTAVLALGHRPLREVETIVPDAIGDRPPVAASA